MRGNPRLWWLRWDLKKSDKEYAEYIEEAHPLQ